MTVIYGGSAQIIGNVDISYKQDNLIAGGLQLVTQNVILLANQGVLARGTVLGKNKDGVYVVSKATATDGSQNPSAVLIDTYDTGTDNLSGAGVYLTGEFNANRIIKDESWDIDKLRDAARAYSIFFKDVINSNNVKD